jgi:SAM-dependent methyltransferase
MPAFTWDDKAEYLMKTRKVMFNDDYLSFLVERVWKISRPVSVVDFGCGLGFLGMKLLPLLPEGSSYTGIDRSGPLLDQARGIFAKTRYEACFMQADIADWDAGLCEYDIAICQALLLHLAEPGKMLDKMAQTVKPGGMVICIDPCWNGAMASMHIEELEINKRVDLGVLQRLYEFDRRQTGKDGNIGLKVPVYLRRLGLENVQSRLSDAVAYLHPDLDAETKEMICGALDADGYTKPPKDTEGMVRRMMGRGATEDEARAEYERERYLAENLRDHALEYNTVFAYHMVISFGTKP